MYFPVGFSNKPASEAMIYLLWEAISNSRWIESMHVVAVTPSLPKYWTRTETGLLLLTTTKHENQDTKITTNMRMISLDLPSHVDKAALPGGRLLCDFGGVDRDFSRSLTTMSSQGKMQGLSYGSGPATQATASC